jgi:hypothetical protein
VGGSLDPENQLVTCLKVLIEIVNLLSTENLRIANQSR